MTESAEYVPAIRKPSAFGRLVARLYWVVPGAFIRSELPPLRAIYLWFAGYALYLDEYRMEQSFLRGDWEPITMLPGDQWAMESEGESSEWATGTRPE